MTKDFTTTLMVDQTPQEAFNAINNVRGWWSEEIEGSTDKLNDVFKYRYEDAHNCQIKLIEVVPDKKVVWLVLNNYFNFTKDNSEWTGTKIHFEIAEKNGKTQIRFTHVGLSEYECFEICSNAWTNYIQGSLRDLIATGKGRPNATGKPTTEDEKKFSNQQNKKSKKIEQDDYSVSIVADVSPEEAFRSINSVTKWWTENLQGNSERLNDEFTVRFGNVHQSTQKLVEVIPNQKVVWLITESNLNFLAQKDEWTNTKIVFEISQKGDKTQVRFTHEGLLPKQECFDACSSAWNQYIQHSLLNLITTGKGDPTPKEVSQEKKRKVTTPD